MAVIRYRSTADWTEYHDGAFVLATDYDALLAVLRQCVEALQKQFAYDRLYGQPIMERNLDAIEAARRYIECKEEEK